MDETLKQAVAPATPSDVAPSRASTPTQGERLISLLLAARRPLLNNEIALKLGIKKNQVRSIISRLVRKKLVIKDGDGYTLPKLKAENVLESKIGIIDREKRLPKLHNIHLLFKTENISKCLGQQKGLNTLFDEENDRKVTASARGEKGRKGSTYGNETVASLSSPVAPNACNNLLASNIINRLTNPLDDYYIASVWPRARTRDIKGGFQEKFLIFTDCVVTIQLRHNGTIQIASGNSEHPFTSAEFVSFLNVLDGIFLARADISFREIAPFFFVDSVHINSDDDPAGREMSGASKLNITTNQLEEGLIRIYEKVLGGIPKVRTEFQLNGNYQQHSLGNLEPILATIFGGVDSTTSVAAALVANKSAQTASEDVRALARETRNTNKLLQDFIRVSIERDQRQDQRLARLEAKVGT